MKRRLKTLWYHLQYLIARAKLAHIRKREENDLARDYMGKMERATSSQQMNDIRDQYLNSIQDREERYPAENAQLKQDILSH